MDFSQKRSLRDEQLNDSWVEVRQGGTVSGTVTPSSVHSGHRSLTHEQMENLLLEAQRESSRSNSCRTSCPVSPPGSTVPSRDRSVSSRDSLHSPHNECEGGLLSECTENPFPHSPPLSLLPGDSILPALTTTDWIWDWSSRPDIVQQTPSEYSSRLRHPMKKSSSGLSVRKTNLMKQDTSISGLLYSFFFKFNFFVGVLVGGVGVLTTMYVFPKKFNNWTAILLQPTKNMWLSKPGSILTSPSTTLSILAPATANKLQSLSSVKLLWSSAGETAVTMLPVVVPRDRTE